MKKIAASIVAMAVAGMVVVGCGQSAPATKPAEQPKPAEPAAPAIEKPAATTVTGKSADGKLEVKLVVAGKVASAEFKATGFNLNSKFAKKDPGKDVKNAANEGHFIVTLDDKEPQYLATLRPSFKDLAAGKHKLKVQMVNNDNSPLGSEVTVEFEVK